MSRLLLFSALNYLFSALNYLFSALCYLKTAFLLANHNREIFSCILLSEVAHEKSVSSSSALFTFESSDSLSSFLDFLASGSSSLALLSLAGRFPFPLTF